MNRVSARVVRVLVTVGLVAALTGCVERTIRVESDPPGARVFLNDEEIGVTPAKTSFLWYGDYDVILRKDGFETLKTHHRIDPPWYQRPPFDLVAECLIATTIRDEHVFPTYKLTPATPPPVEEVIQRAVKLQAEALGRDR